MTGKVASAERPLEPTPAEREQQLEPILFPPATIRQQASAWPWVNLLFTLGVAFVTQFSLPLLATFLVLIGGQLAWGRALIRNPERYQRNFFLYLAYVSAICSLAFAVISVALAPGGQAVLVALYVLGVALGWLLAPRRVSAEIKAVSGKPKKWYTPGSSSSKLLAGAGAGGVVVAELLLRYASPDVSHFAFAALFLVVAATVIQLSWYNLQKYRRYPVLKA